jgi:hypothetical protein
MKFETGIFDRVRIVSNIIMLILVAGNIYFSVQYTQNMLKEQSQQEISAAKDEVRFQSATFLKFFVDKVLTTNGVISYADRVKLESDIRQMNDSRLIEVWDEFVASTDPKEAQTSVVKLMSMLVSRML